MFLQYLHIFLQTRFVGLRRNPDSALRDHASMNLAFFRQFLNLNDDTFLTYTTAGIEKSMKSWYPGYQSMSNLAGNFGRAEGTTSLQLRINSQLRAEPMAQSATNV